jgi:hypothetical protein
VCDELIRYDDLRHYMAHGLMTLYLDGEGGRNHEVELRRYERLREGQFRLCICKKSLEELRRDAAEITRYGQDAADVFWTVWLGQKVEGYSADDEEDWGKER